MNTAALDIKAFWHNVWDDRKKKQKQFIIDIKGGKSVKHWQVGLRRVGTKYYAKKTNMERRYKILQS